MEGMEKEDPRLQPQPEPTEPTGAKNPTTSPVPAPRLTPEQQFPGMTPAQRDKARHKLLEHTYPSVIKRRGKVGPPKYVDANGVQTLRNNRHKLDCACNFCVPTRPPNPNGPFPKSIPDDPGPQGAPKPLSQKAARFIKFFCDPRSTTYLKRRPSMTRAGYGITHKSAHLGAPAQAAIRAAFEKVGITPTLLAKRVKEGLDATSTEVISFKGEVTDKVELVDYSERRQNVELAMRVRNDIPRDIGVEGSHVHLHIPARLSEAAWDATVTATAVPAPTDAQSPYPAPRALLEAPGGPDEDEDLNDEDEEETSE